MYNYNNLSYLICCPPGCLPKIFLRRLCRQQEQFHLQRGMRSYLQIKGTISMCIIKSKSGIDMIFFLWIHFFKSSAPKSLLPNGSDPLNPSKIYIFEEKKQLILNPDFKSLNIFTFFEYFQQ